MLQIPIFHVNGEDPEAVACVVRLAMDFRHQFKRDVVIDMYCYRRRGHNEGDEPSFTQPLLYRAIEKRKSVRDGYLDRLLELGEITREEAELIAREQTRQLDQELSVARSDDYVARPQVHPGVWKGYVGGRDTEVPEADTRMDRGRLAELLEALTHLPADFRPHPKIERWLEARREMARGAKPLDWAAGEALAFASLAERGYRIRLSGQDSTRGTFSQRHAVLHDYQDGHRYTPLQHISKGQAPVEIINSPLSEAGVLGFEYGYSLDCPHGLVMWEAQFGDFVNAAQVIIDQFIASAETKWKRLSGLVLLLPHGFEGMGPEHSSARLERFLALAAESNMQIMVPSTPAQIFHALRRQVLRAWRKPLVVMTPKSLLRHPQAVSTLEDCAAGEFRAVIPDVQPERPNVEGVLICSGKLYYELATERQELGREDVAIVRMEQLYPLPMERLKEALAPYRDGTPVYWVQEEPENMGAWRFLLARFGGELFDRLPFSGIYRRASPSPATGSASSHRMEQKELLMQAFGCI
jgi:2-oxoglutarate dehydrogenase E1 component